MENKNKFKLDIVKFKEEFNNFLDKISSTKELDDAICTDKFVIQITNYIDNEKDANLNFSAYFETFKGINKTAHQLVKAKDIDLDIN